MTLEEAIKELRTPTPYGPQFDEDMLQLAEWLEELKVLRKAYGLMSKEYCESMGCSFCNNHTKCLEVCHFEDIDGKAFLQEYFLQKAREE